MAKMTNPLEISILAARRLNRRELQRRAIGKALDMYFPNGNFSTTPPSADELRYMRECAERDGLQATAKLLGEAV